LAPHPDRLPKERAIAGITDRVTANRCLAEACRPRCNAGLAVPARGEGSAFVPWIGVFLDDIRRGRFERTAGHHNCARFGNLRLQIPAGRRRWPYVKAKARVRRYPDDTLAIFHGPRGLARYPCAGKLITAGLKRAARTVRQGRKPASDFVFRPSPLPDPRQKAENSKNSRHCARSPFYHRRQTGIIRGLTSLKIRCVSCF
jgi:hypothetical protein